MILVGLCAFLILAFFAFTRRSQIAIDPYTVFFLSMVTYTFYVPLAMRFFGDSDLVFDATIELRITDDEWHHVMLLASVALIASSITFQAVASWAIWPTIKEVIDRIDQQKLRFDYNGQVLVIVTFIAVAALLALHYDKLSVAAEGYSDAYTTVYENSLYAWQLYLAAMSVLTLIQYFILSQKRYIVVFMIGASVFLSASLLLSSKSYLLGVFLMCLSVFYRLGFRSRMGFLTFSVGGMIIGFLFILPAYGILRGGGEIDFSYFSNANPATFYSDAPGPFSTVIFLLQGRNWSLLTDAINTAPVAASLILWIPRSLWPDRPLDMAEAFSRFLLDGWQPGQGVAFSPIAEGMLRYGDWGALIVPATIGLLSASLIAGFLRLYPKSLWPSLLMSVGAYVLFYSQRGAISQVVSMIMQFFLVHAIMFKCVSFFFQPRGVKASSAGMPSPEPTT